MWKIFGKSQKEKIREHYMKLRLDAIEAQKRGDKKTYIVLNAIADRMIDQVIYF
ncbi:MAG: DUF6435 family protein [Cytophagaceae bacterium]